jgi:hypothetical protein
MSDTTTEPAASTTTTTTDAVDTSASTATTATTDSTATTASAEGEGKGGTETTTDTTTTEGAPEAYAAFNVPDGYTLEGERLEKLHAFAKANKWTQAQAQAAVDHYIELDQQGHVATREQRVELWTEQSKTEYGDKFDAIAADARAGVTWAQQHRPNMLKTFDDEGWGSNPDALWVFAKLGELTRGDKMDGLGNATSNGAGGRSIEDRLWPKK